MINWIVRSVVLTGWMLLGAVAVAEQNNAPYDLIFRTGTLDGIEDGERLLYERSVINQANPDAAERISGDIELSLEPSEPRIAKLTFLKDDKSRTVGEFPASVGNPLIMFMVESVLRDMAATAGGSPFYIRTVIKEALIGEAEIAEVGVPFGDRQIAAREITLRPFLEDPNRDRMRGFGDLSLTFTMSDEVPGWYHTLKATVADPTGGSDPVYSTVLRLQPPEDAG